MIHVAHLSSSSRPNGNLNLTFSLLFLFILSACAMQTAKSQTAAAQTLRRIQGVVRGADGATLPARVTVEDLKTHRKQSLQSTNEGGFTFAGVPVGRYSVTVQAQGLSPQTKIIELTTGQIVGVSLSAHLARASSVDPSAAGIMDVRTANPIELITSSKGRGNATKRQPDAALRSSAIKATVAGTNSPADFNIYSPVIAPAPLRFGFNEAFSDGLINNSWVLTNGGGSPSDARLPLSATNDGTDTTLISTDAGGPGTDYYQSIISGFFVGATSYTYRFQDNAWTLLRKDTVTGYTAVPGSTNPADFTITFATSGPATRKGDVIWLDKDADPNPLFQDFYYRNASYSNVYLYWSTEQQTGYPINPTPGTTPPAPLPYTLVPDVPSGTGGPTTQYSVQLTDTKTELQGLTNYLGPSYQCNDQGSQKFAPGHIFEVGVWLKQTGVSDGNVTFALGQMNVSHTFTGVTGSWQYFTWDFPAPACLPDNNPYPTVKLDFNAPGTMFENGLHVFDKTTAPYTLDSRIQQAWTDYKPSTLRIWSNFAASSGGYAYWSLDSWIEPENRSRSAPQIGNYYTDNVDALHLPAALQTAKQIGANPWLIVSMSLSAEEWGNLVDYLSAPAGTPGYASRRPADHPGPYTDDFPTIYLEVGNEEWGTQNTPVNFAYGQWVHYVASSSTSGKSYANLNQLKFVTNSFFLNPSFGSAAVAQAPESTVVDYALYSGGDQTLTGDPYFQSDLIQLPATNKTLIDGMVAQQQNDAANGHPYTLAAYEAGPGQDTPVHEGDPTLAAAVATMDVHLYASLRGFGPINFFLFGMGPGPYSSHSTFDNGFFPHPVWEAMQMRNAYLNGDMVWTVGNTVPTVAAPDGNNYPALSVYGFRDNSSGNNQADIVVISRDLTNTTPVTLHFPGTPSGTGNLYTLTGDPRGDNNTALNIPIGNQTLSGLTKDYTFSMPPGSIYIFQVPINGDWSTQIPAPATPANLSAVSDNGRVQLAWASVDGSSTYHVKRATTEGGPYTTVANATGPGYTDTSVTNGTTYYYVVTAANVGGESANSNEVIGTPNVAIAPLTNTQPPLDGSNTGAWVSAPTFPLTHDFNSYTPDSASYKTLWDSSFLYILATVKDATPAISTGPYAAFTGDSVEVYFSGTDSKSNAYGPTDFQFAFPYGTSAVLESKHNALDGIVFNQQNIAGGYQFAIAIPWSTLGTTPSANRQYGLDVMVNDATSPNNRIGKLAWWGTRDFTYSDPSLMGPLILSPAGILPATSTALGIDPSSNLSALSPWTLTATVQSPTTSTVPTGTVTFNVAGHVNATHTVKLNAQGQAIYQGKVPSSGTYSVTASYNGSSALSASVSAVSTIAATALETSTALAVSPTSGLAYGQNWTLTANVTSPSGNTVNGGTVNFTFGSWHKSARVNSSGVATYTGAVPSPGSQTLTAAYSGNSDFAGSSTSTPITVGAESTTTVLTVTPTSGLEAGAPWQMTAVVTSASGQPVTTGTVTFQLAGPHPTSWTRAVNQAGSATHSDQIPYVGTYTLTATYNGVTGYSSSSSSPQQEVVGTAALCSAITLTQSPSNNLIAGQPWVLTAFVTETKNKVIPTGTVTFNWDKTSATATIDSTGKAVYNGTIPPIGVHTVTAHYPGASNLRRSTSNAISFNSIGTPTTTGLTVSPTGTLTTGQAITLTAAVSPTSGTTVPTGNVTITVGSKTSTVALDTTGKATLTTTAPVPGNYSFTAAYAGSATLAASTSPAVNVTVNGLASITTLSISPSTDVTSGQTWTLTATVAPQGSSSLVPDGSVTFKIGSKSTTIALDSTGKAVYPTTAPVPGTYTVSASYSGSASFSASASAPATVIVGGITTTTTLAVSPSGTLTAGQPVTYSVSVSAISGGVIPSGNVALTIGNVTQTISLSSSGVATLSGTAPAMGTYSVLAAYAGAGNFASSSSTAANLSVVAVGTPIPVAVPNPSFELDQTGYNVPVNWAFTSVPGISGSYALQEVGKGNATGVDGTNYWAPSDFNPSNAPYGTTTALLTSAQSLGTFAANTGYALTVALADPADNTDPSTKLVGFNLLANGKIVSQFAFASLVPGAGFQDFTLKFYTSSHPEVVGQAITVALVYSYSGAYNRAVYFDNVRLFQSYGIADPSIPTTTTVSFSPGNTVTTGNSFTVTAKVAPTSGTAVAAGSVLFTVGTATQTMVLDGNGTAVYSGTASDPGTYNVTAAYSGSSGTTPFASSVSPGATLTVVALTGVAPVTGLTAISGDGLASLAWSAAANALSYNVYQGSTSGGENPVPVQTGIVGTTATITNLTNGSSYFFTVRGINGNLVSDPSNEVSVVPVVAPAGNPPLAYEPFDVPNGALQGVADGSGWSDSWSEQSSSTDIPGYNVASATPLTYPGLASSQNYGIGGFAYQSSGRGLDISSSGAFSSYLNGGLIGAPGKVLYLSFLMRKDSNNNQPSWIALHGSNIEEIPGSTQVAGGYFGDGSTPYWSLNVNGTITNSTKPVIVGASTLLVVKVVFGATNAVSLYVNPPAGSEPAVADASATTPNLPGFRSLAWLAGYGTNTGSLDEIRIGAAFADVTPSH